MPRCARFLLAVLLTIILVAGCGGQEQGGESKEKAAAPEPTEETATKAKTTAVEQTSATTTARSETKAETTQTTSSPPNSQRSSEKAESEALANAEVTATVSRVVDGDTIEISPAIDGISDVRLIGVDTPETKKPSCTPQPYGAEASAFTTTQLQGQQVILEFDVEKTDRYDRLLAYVYTSGGAMFNDTLLREGYAQLATFPPNVKYVERFQEAQAEARAAAKGLWGQSPEQLAQQTDRGNGIGGDGCTPPASQTASPPQQQQEPEPTPAPDSTPEPPAPREVQPLPPPGGDVDCGDLGPGEAQQYLLPGDPYRLDRDGDGIACE